MTLLAYALKNIRGLVLFPIFYSLSFFWLLAHHLRLRFGKHQKMPLPVVCVGNITLGGAGKTPTVIFLASYLKKHNINAHVVSRGYGGKFKDTVFVDGRRHTASEVGDEPLLISRYANVWVSRIKREGIFAAYKAGADLVLLDDGHQNFSIFKNMSILVLDAEHSLKNERIFPLGNLRESASSAINRADFLICIGKTDSRKKFKENFIKNHNSKIIEGEFKPDIVPELYKRKVVAFCGIGRPEKFFSMLKNLNMQVIQEVPFPDHHFYSKKELTKILETAEKNNALVVTTEKDYVKLSGIFKQIIHPINIELNLEKNKKLLKEIKNLIF